MSNSDKPQSDAPSPAREAGASCPPSRGRRRLLQGGLAVTPVVAILKSREVLASTSGALQCRAVSAYLSGSSHLSHHPEGEYCAGRTPGYWKTHPEEWPTDYGPGTCKGNTPCNSAESWDDDGAKMTGVWPLAAGIYGSATMMQVLWMGGSEDRWQAGAHLVAAALNNLTGKVSEAILPWARIVAMGNAILGGAVYQAAPGVSWNGEELVAYLKQTMPL